VLVPCCLILLTLLSAIPARLERIPVESSTFPGNAKPKHGLRLTIDRAGSTPTVTGRCGSKRRMALGPTWPIAASACDRAAQLAFGAAILRVSGQIEIAEGAARGKQSSRSPIRTWREVKVSVYETENSDDLSSSVTASSMLTTAARQFRRS